LFHHQSEDYITQTIKDTIPYFLGVVTETALELENERSRLKRELRIKKKNFDENQYLKGNVSERAITLINEAHQAGLIDKSIQIDYQDYQKMYSILENVVHWQPEEISYDSGMKQLIALQTRFQEMTNELNDIEFSIDNTKRFIGEKKEYSRG